MAKSSANKVHSVVAAVQDFDLANSSAWADVEGLASKVYVEGCEADPGGIIVQGSNFEGALNVYLSLEYGDGEDDGFSMSESFVGRFAGHFDKNGKAVIETVEVDTSPFYE